MWGGGERGRGRGRGRSVTRLYGHETSSSPSSTCASSYIGTTTSLSATDEKFERKRLFVTAATASLRLPCPALPSPTLLLETVAKAYTTIGIHKHRTFSHTLDCRRYCSLVKTWQHISQGWTLHRIKAGRQQTNCLWQRMLYCLLDLMDRQFLPRYLWMMRLGIPHCDTTCTFSCFKVYANLP